MKLQFYGNGPGLVVENESRLLVVADLHFGIEGGLAAHGLHFRSRSSERLERLHRTIDAADPDLIVLLGDIKHSIPSVTRQEYSELPDLLRSIRDRLPLRVFPGNHDSGIEPFLLGEELQPKDGAILDGVGYLHGHMYPSPHLGGHLMISGHHHPLLMLKDEVGCALQTPAYLRAGVDARGLGLDEPPGSASPTRVLFMPSFNEIAGYDIQQIVRKPFSPLSRYMNCGDAEIILSDGTYIGPLSLVQSDETG